jgi:tetratricopeptide (TPR) repeat protein
MINPLYNFILTCNNQQKTKIIMIKFKKHQISFSKINCSIKFISVFLFVTLLLTSCYKKQENINNPFYVKAQKYYNDGDYNKSSFYYQKYLNLYPKSSKANYKLATIYLDQENYIQSIFHFKRFLTLEPNSPDKEIIEKWINASEASLYKVLEKEYSDTEAIPQAEYKENIKLEKKIDNLKKKNEQMRDFILKHKKSLLLDTATKNTNITNLNNPKINKNNVTRTYEVKSGDSLYKISEKMYNTSKYHKLVWEANKDKLVSPSSLRPGDILTIPPIKK